MSLDSSPLFRRSVHFLFLAAAACAALAPFSGKAFHIDDPLFVWAAKQIAAHPLDFYGFNVHWYATWEPMAEVTQNPPLGCYYLAAAGAIFGWSETALHWAMMLPTCLALFGTYRVAERLDAKPLMASLLTLSTPAFRLSATSVMCDVPMLACWLWTIVFWDEGLRDRKLTRLWLAGVLIAITTLTKYFGVSLIPLLAAYSWSLDRRAWRQWCRPLLLAIALLACYQVLTWMLYGQGLLGRAMGYAVGLGNPTLGMKTFRIFSGLAFLGGCIGAWALAALFLNGKRAAAIFIVVPALAVAASLGLVGLHETDGYIWTDSPFAPSKHAYYGPQADLIAQLAIWAAIGAALIVFCWQDYREENDSRALLLGLWSAGTFAFAAFVNWTLNGRSVLPLVPAIAIVLVRRLTRVFGESWPAWLIAGLLAPALALSFILCEADRSMADAQRSAANSITERYSQTKPLWFAGHWGFQYYMMERGAVPWDGMHDRGKPGDLIAIPSNNCNISPFEWKSNLVESLYEPLLDWATVMNAYRAAGFYAEIWGPLPFTFGRVPPENYEVRQLLQKR